MLRLPCIYTNADQFLNKRHELKTLIEMRKPLVIGSTEINYKSLNHAIEEAEISLEGYVLYHNLQEQHTRRGICLWIHNSIKSAGLPNLENSFKEAIFVECPLAGADSLLIEIFYRSPTNAPENNEALNQAIHNVSKTKHMHKLLMGDFNYREIGGTWRLHVQDQTIWQQHS